MTITIVVAITETGTLTEAQVEAYAAQAAAEVRSILAALVAPQT